MLTSLNAIRQVRGSRFSGRSSALSVARGRLWPAGGAQNPHGTTPDPAYCAPIYAQSGGNAASGLGNPLQLFCARIDIPSPTFPESGLSAKRATGIPKIACCKLDPSLAQRLHFHSRPTLTACLPPVEFQRGFRTQTQLLRKQSAHCEEAE